MSDYAQVKDAAMLRSFIADGHTYRGLSATVDGRLAQVARRQKRPPRTCSYNVLWKLATGRQRTTTPEVASAIERSLAVPIGQLFERRSVQSSSRDNGTAA